VVESQCRGIQDPEARPESVFALELLDQALSSAQVLTVSKYITMPKRKREDGVDEAAGGKGGGIKKQRAAHKLDQGVKRVAHAFKLAKGFERQKLSRRRKTAVSKGEDKDVERIDAEIVALKVRKINTDQTWAGI